eukprot:EC826133.1.p1 GENE.EC826133.1~~EC826133.1.p1  ORF type:complete len:109 (-),score=63.41 EC826133.1:90-416(-)
MADHGKVVIINSKEQYDKEKKTGKVIVDFFATWCGPCKMIAPTFVEWSNTYDKIKFLKVDVDDQTEVSEAEKIEAMPTFKFFVNGEEKTKIVGANKKKIEEIIKDNNN